MSFVVGLVGLVLVLIGISPLLGVQIAPWTWPSIVAVSAGCLTLGVAAAIWHLGGIKAELRRKNEASRH